MKRILHVINMQTDLDQNTAGYTDELEGRIQFENVTFGYSTKDQGSVLEDV